MDADVSVIGLGRVGLPLALSFADRGLKVVGIDRDEGLLGTLRDGRMPFHEHGAEDVLSRVIESGRLTVSGDVVDAAAARHIVLTVGTPSFSHIEIDVSEIRSVLDELLPVIAPGHSIVLRSTIAPGTTEFVAGYLAKRRNLVIGEDIHVAHAPERIAAGRFFEEIDTLPCIIGGVGRDSGEHVAELFGVFDAPIRQTSPAQAELAKIWTNILRYTHFALPNLLMMDCEQYGANVFEVIDLINRDYPRGGMAQPGLTAGTCLRKDFAFSEERSHAPGMLLAVSRVNESVPLFLVEGLKRRLGGVNGRKVAVLGLAFKADTDDIRESAAIDVIEHLLSKGARVKAHDYRGMENMKEVFKERVEWCNDPVTAAAGADAVALVTDWPQYTTLPFRKIAATMNQPIIFDGRNCLQRDVMRENGFQYYPMGRPAVENALRLKARV